MSTQADSKKHGSWRGKRRRLEPYEPPVKTFWVRRSAQWHEEADEMRAIIRGAISQSATPPDLQWQRDRRRAPKQITEDELACAYWVVTINENTEHTVIRNQTARKTYFRRIHRRDRGVSGAQLNAAFQACLGHGCHGTLAPRLLRALEHLNLIKKLANYSAGQRGPIYTTIEPGSEPVPQAADLIAEAKIIRPASEPQLLMEWAFDTTLSEVRASASAAGIEGAGQPYQLVPLHVQSMLHPYELTPLRAAVALQVDKRGRYRLVERVVVSAASLARSGARIYVEGWCVHTNAMATVYASVSCFFRFDEDNMAGYFESRSASLVESLIKVSNSSPAWCDCHRVVPPDEVLKANRDSFVLEDEDHVLEDDNEPDEIDVDDLFGGPAPEVEPAVLERADPAWLADIVQEQPNQGSNTSIVPSEPMVFDLVIRMRDPRPARILRLQNRLFVHFEEWR